MEKIKRYSLTVSAMLITAFLTLFVVGIFTYFFKWQADKARIGIIITYVLAGFVGGCFSKEERSGVAKMLVEAMTISFLFLFMLLIVSILIQQSAIHFSEKILLIYGLVVSSVYLGSFVRKNKKFVF